MNTRPFKRSKRLKFRAGWRDTTLLLREFQIPLLIFLIASLGIADPYRDEGEAGLE